MKLIKPIAPTEYVCAMRTGLAQFVDPDDTSAALLLQNHEAYEVYSLNLVEFAKHKDLGKAATSVGWRFLTADPTGDMGCHVGGSGRPQIIAVARTPDVHVAFHRLREMEDLIQRRTSSRWVTAAKQPYFELRGLRIPSLLIEGVWLHRPRRNGLDASDFLVPCLGFTKAEGADWRRELELLEPYSPDDFLKAIAGAPVLKELRADHKHMAR
jgi:hypothetical protein